MPIGVRRIRSEVISFTLITWLQDVHYYHLINVPGILASANHRQETE